MWDYLLKSELIHEPELYYVIEARKKDGKRITNAKTDGFNNSVKVIKRTSYGYANFKRFRNRILYILRDYAPITI